MHWDLSGIRRFMLTFGPVSSLFDFLTFAILLSVLHAGPVEFRSGWFVESLATQTLVVFVIRTHRSPPWRSRPGTVLSLSVLAGVAAATALPYPPLAGPLGFTALPLPFLGTVAVLTLVYLALVETTKRVVLTPSELVRTAPRTPSVRRRRVHRRAARFSTGRWFRTGFPRTWPARATTPRGATDPFGSMGRDLCRCPAHALGPTLKVAEERRLPWRR